MLKDPFKDIFFAIYAVKIDVTWSLSDLMSSELIIHVLLRRLSLVKRSLFTVLVISSPWLSYPEIGLAYTT